LPTDVGPWLQGLQLVPNKPVWPAAFRRRDQYFERLLWVGSSRSVPAGPSRPSAAPRATLDSRRRSVQSRAQAAAHKASLCPPARLGRLRAKDFLPCGWNPRHCWVLAWIRSFHGRPAFPG